MPNGPCLFYINSIYSGIRSAFISWIPSILVILLNIFIIKALAKAKTKRKEMVSLLPLNKNFIKMKSISLPKCSPRS